MVRTVPKDKIEQLVAKHQRRYASMRDMLKDGFSDGSPLDRETETEINAQLHETGHFIEQLEELL